MSKEIKMHRLPDGEEIPEAAWRAIMITIEDLGPTELYEAIELARNPEHKLWSEKIAKRLRAASLIDQDGRMHDVVRSVLRSLE